MSATTDPEPTPRRRRILPMLAGVLGAILLGAGGFHAVSTGLILAPESVRPPPVSQDFAHLPIESVTITLPEGSNARFLRFSGQIEVAAGSLADMQRLHPRFLDMINTYLRAVDVPDLTEPGAILRLRAQILRRLQVIAGDGHVRDLLITEFVLN